MSRFQDGVKQKVGISLVSSSFLHSSSYVCILLILTKFSNHNVGGRFSSRQSAFSIALIIAGSILFSMSCFVFLTSIFTGTPMSSSNLLSVV
jgi:hypothetical protein